MGKPLFSTVAIGLMSGAWLWPMSPIAALAIWLGWWSFFFLVLQASSWQRAFFRGALLGIFPLGIAFRWVPEALEVLLS